VVPASSQRCAGGAGDVHFSSSERPGRGDSTGGAGADAMEDDNAPRPPKHPPDSDGEPVLDEQDLSLGPRPGHVSDDEDTP
jgi:hypothetical protein